VTHLWWQQLLSTDLRQAAPTAAWMNVVRSWWWRPLVVATAAVSVCPLFFSTACAEDPAISMRRAAERTSFSDGEITDGFFKTAFKAELQFDRKTDRIRKFDEPVRVFIDNRAAPDRHAQLAEVIAGIRDRVKNLDLAITEDRQKANFVVFLVQRAELENTIRSRYGANRAKQIEKVLAPECLSGIGRDSSYRIRRAEAILPVDAGDFFFLDCAYEELLQGLGIINDDSSVPWTMFNDNVQMGFFDVYDQYLVNILYDSRIRPGMTKRAVEQMLPKVLPAVRSWVAREPLRTSHVALP
jgi:hypothetical protein